MRKTIKRPIKSRKASKKAYKSNHKDSQRSQNQPKSQREPPTAQEILHEEDDKLEINYMRLQMNKSSKGSLHSSSNLFNLSPALNSQTRKNIRSMFSEPIKPWTMVPNSNNSIEYEEKDVSNRNASKVLSKPFSQRKRSLRVQKQLKNDLLGRRSNHRRNLSLALKKSRSRTEQSDLDEYGKKKSFKKRVAYRVRYFFGGRPQHKILKKEEQNEEENDDREGNVKDEKGEGRDKTSSFSKNSNLVDVSRKSRKGVDLRFKTLRPKSADPFERAPKIKQEVRGERTLKSILKKDPKGPDFQGEKVELNQAKTKKNEHFRAKKEQTGPKKLKSDQNSHQMEQQGPHNNSSEKSYRSKYRYSANSRTIKNLKARQGKARNLLYSKTHAMSIISDQDVKFKDESKLTILVSSQKNKKRAHKKTRSNPHGKFGKICQGQKPPKMAKSSIIPNNWCKRSPDLIETWREKSLSYGFKFAKNQGNPKKRVKRHNFIRSFRVRRENDDNVNKFNEIYGDLCDELDFIHNKLKKSKKAMNKGMMRIRYINRNSSIKDYTLKRQGRKERRSLGGGDNALIKEYASQNAGPNMGNQYYFDYEMQKFRTVGEKKC